MKPGERELQILRIEQIISIVGTVVALVALFSVS